MAENCGRSRILIIGVTGKLGFELAKASINASHPTLGLVREMASPDPIRSRKLRFLSDAGLRITKGSLEDQDILMEAVRQVDVVICAVSSRDILHQRILISVIKRAGCIKRYFPAEFGSDPDRTRIAYMDNSIYSKKVTIRRMVEAEGIPYTYVSCNFFAGYFLPSLLQPCQEIPPRDKVNIFGDGNTKAVFVKESDVATFTISTVDDPRTLNKIMYLRPPENTISMNEIVDLWEEKIGKHLERNYFSEEELLNRINEASYPDKLFMAFIHSALVKGDQTNFDIDGSNGLEGTKLYPNIKYTTISEYLDTLL